MNSDNADVWFLCAQATKVQANKACCLSAAAEAARSRGRAAREKEAQSSTGAAAGWDWEDYVDRMLLEKKGLDRGEGGAIVHFLLDHHMSLKDAEDYAEEFLQAPNPNRGLRLVWINSLQSQKHLLKYEPTCRAATGEQANTADASRLRQTPCNSLSNDESDMC